MTSFAGLCVGGPLAGKLMVRDNAAFTLEERVGHLRQKPIKGQSPVMNVKSHLYCHYKLGEQGLWIHDSMTLNQAIAEIAAGYIEACKQADPRVIPSFSR